MQALLYHLSFSPTYCLEALRPLGSIMRARLQAYPVQSLIRREVNGDMMPEPNLIEKVLA